MGSGLDGERLRGLHRTRVRRSAMSFGDFDALCETCGERLVYAGVGRKPRFCNARCRKRSYSGSCLDCGAPTSGCNGKDHAPSQCRSCATEQLNEARSKSGHQRSEIVAALYREGLTAWEAAERLGVSVATVRSLAARARNLGIVCPNAPTGARAHRRQAAA